MSGPFDNPVALVSESVLLGDGETVLVHEADFVLREPRAAGDDTGEVPADGRRSDLITFFFTLPELSPQARFAVVRFGVRWVQPEVFVLRMDPSARAVGSLPRRSVVTTFPRRDGMRWTFTAQPEDEIVEGGAEVAVRIESPAHETGLTGSASCEVVIVRAALGGEEEVVARLREDLPFDVAFR